MNSLKEIDELDKKVRNMALSIIMIGIGLMMLWLIYWVIFSSIKLQIILYLGIGLFLGGLLFLSRIQFVMWAKKKEKEAFLKIFLIRST
ncbi:MAG: hypothetical protein ACTSUN_00535 [Promethearchaeota archaeon]